MAHLHYFNHWANITEIFYDSHKELIEKICIDLGQPEKRDELVSKYLDDRTKIKPKKDPNEPKRARSAYLLFCNDKRPSLVKKKPDLKITEIMVQLGKDWKKLSDKSKEKYHELSEKDKSRYEEELEQYQNSLHMQELMAYSDNKQNQLE